MCKMYFAFRVVPEAPGQLRHRRPSHKLSSCDGDVLATWVLLDLLDQEFTGTTSTPNHPHENICISVLASQEIRNGRAKRHPVKRSAATYTVVHKLLVSTMPIDCQM